MILKRQQSFFNHLYIFDNGCYIREVSQIFFSFWDIQVETRQGRIENEGEIWRTNARPELIQLKGELHKKLKRQDKNYNKEYYTIEKREYAQEKGAFVFLNADNITQEKMTLEMDTQTRTRKRNAIQYNGQTFCIDTDFQFIPNELGEKIKDLQEELKKIYIDLNGYDLEKILKHYDIVKK